MAWTTLTYAYGSTLTSTKMTQNQDNFTAVAQGLSGAPKIQTAALQDYLLSATKWPLLVSGTTYLLASNDHRVAVQSATPTFAKGFRISQTGTLSFQFDLYTNNASNAAYGRIYKNGVATGTLRSTTTTTALTSIYTESISVTAADIIELYCWNASGVYQGKNTFLRVLGNAIPPGLFAASVNYNALV